jgi:hypothetical protein
MKKLLCSSFVLLATLAIVPSAFAITINGQEYKQLIEFKHPQVSISSCGQTLHSGDTFSNPETIAVQGTNIASEIAGIQFSNVELLIQGVNKDPAFTHTGGGNFFANTNGGAFTLTGVVNGVRQNLLVGTYLNSQVTAFTPNKTMTWNSLLNGTSGLFYDVLGGANFAGGFLPLYQTAALSYSIFNGLDFIACGDLGLHFQTSAVPEPLTGALLLSGLAAGAIKRRKKTV